MIKKTHITANINDQELDLLTSKVIDVLKKVYSELGPELLCSVYRLCVIKELRNLNIKVSPQIPLSLLNKNNTKSDYKIDLLIDNSIILELKAVDRILPGHHSVMNEFLTLAGKSLGIIFNFNSDDFEEGLAMVSYKKSAA